MRTTIRIDDDLLRAAKQYAAKHDKTLTSLVEDALRQLLVRQEAAPARTPVQLITDSGNGLQPGIDLDDTSTLLDIMEGL
jgi:K+-transporting ATPase c subunit